MRVQCLSVWPGDVQGPQTQGLKSPLLQFVGAAPVEKAPPLQNPMGLKLLSSLPEVGTVLTVGLWACTGIPWTHTCLSQRLITSSGQLWRELSQWLSAGPLQGHSEKRPTGRLSDSILSYHTGFQPRDPYETTPGSLWAQGQFPLGKQILFISSKQTRLCNGISMA